MFTADLKEEEAKAGEEEEQVRKSRSLQHYVFSRSDDQTVITLVQSQPAQTPGEEPEDDKPHPTTAPNQSESGRKKISYAQLVKEGRRFNIDLVSKVTVPVIS